MIKILSARQIKELDAQTIQREPISSVDLMERASRAFTTWFVDRFKVSQPVGVVCGTGNNGGDGLAIARMLQENGFRVKVWIARGGVAESGDFKTNLGRLKQTSITLSDITNAPGDDTFAGCDILIDAIFGTGISRPPEGIYAQVINCVNSTNAVKVAVDVPSGLQVDQPSGDVIVKASITVSFQLPKLSFLLPQSHPFVGEVVVVDISLNKDFITSATSDYFLTTKKDVRKMLKPRSKFDHKGDFGHVLLIAGSYGKIGAAVLGSRAALRSGVGLLTTHVPQCGYAILQTTVPEAMVDADTNETHFTKHPALEMYSVVGTGPGLGKDEATIEALASLLRSCKTPMVLDADALTILSLRPELQTLIPKGSILTPHPKEFQRLVGEWKNDFERLEKQKQLASRLQSVVLVKGAYTTVASPDGKMYFNPTGNPGMATGGTGDVLTGILTGLLGQHYGTLEAALLGVYLHGLAGDLAAIDKGMPSLVASDVVEYLAEAFKNISR